MADVIGILGFALHAAHKVYNVIEAIKDAPGDIQALRDEAFQVRGFLEKILPSENEGGRSVPQRLFNIKDPQIDALAVRAQIISATVDTFIGKVTTQKDDGSYVIKKLKWPLYSGEAKKLSEQFRSFYASLTAVYTVSTSATIDAMSSDLQTQRAAIARMEITLLAMRASTTLHDAAREQREGRSMRFDAMCATATHPAAIPFPRAEICADPATTTSQLRPGAHVAGPGPTENDRDSNDGLGGLKGVAEATRAYGGANISSAPTSLTTDSSSEAQSCPDECSCACHRPSSVISPIPSWLNPWLGKLNIPRALAASLIPSLFPCNDVRCCMNLSKPPTVRYYSPGWFAQVEATICFESFPVHFCIQTPRVVTSLNYLFDISFEDFRIKLSTRELTLQDVETNGFSVLHLFWREQRVGDAFDLIRYAVDAGVPQDWQFMNMTAVEYIVHNVQCYPELRPGAQSLDLTVAKPLLHDSLNETSQTLNAKLRQSDLITFLLQPDRDVEEALGHLRSMLTLPTMSAQMHQPDASDWLPIDYATYAFPEAVEVLLQAGASTEYGSFILHQCTPDQWKVVSALIRAGYPVDERHTNNFGRSPLHFVAAARHPSYRHALELVRHGGHLLNWDARDDNSATPFEYADYFANNEPGNDQLHQIRELYRTHRIPIHAQYISSFDGERLMDAEEAATHPRISLIGTALAGDVKSIGRLLLAGAMVNERDEEGWTLLHHLAMPIPFPKREEVLLEFLRHSGRWGIDWDARSPTNQTALELAVETLTMENIGEDVRSEVEVVHTQVLQHRGRVVLPGGMNYVFPCMDPRYCRKCESLPCTCPENDVPGMPGSFS